jgi:hypothetical protein
MGMSLKVAAVSAALLAHTVSSSARATVSFFAGTGHYYEHVPTVLSWPDARTAAAARSFTSGGNTYSGYLVTIESAAEQQFLSTTFGVGGAVPDGWAGGSDAGHEADWQWVTGPYAPAPVSFWKNGQTLIYANWKAGEPNNSGGAEHYLELGFNGILWNDNTSDTGIAYYVEYAVVPEPVLPLFAVAPLILGRRRRRSHSR